MAHTNNILICARSMDVYQAADFSEKNDAAELVLDGKLTQKRVKEMTPEELLELAQKEFDKASNTISESELGKSWPALRSLSAPRKQRQGESSPSLQPT